MIASTFKNFNISEILKNKDKIENNQVNLNLPQTKEIISSLDGLVVKKEDL